MYYGKITSDSILALLYMSEFNPSNAPVQSTGEKYNARYYKWAATVNKATLF